MTQPDRDRSEPRWVEFSDPRPCQTCGEPHGVRRFGPNGVDSWHHPDDGHGYFPPSWEEFARSLLAATQPPADSEGSADAEHMREVSKYLSRLADKYPDRWHPDISYLRAGANYVGVLAGRAASPVAESGLREALHRLADATEGVLPYVRVGEGPLGDDPAAIAMRRLFDVFGAVRAALAAAAPPAGDARLASRDQEEGADG